MSDEEIKKCLECCISLSCEGCPLNDERGCLTISDEKALDLINRQQERIEELEIITGLANSRKYYRKFVDEVFCKQKGNELSEPDFDYIYQLYFEQQAEIERLNGNLFTISNACMQRRNEAIKEFAERLRAKFHTWQDNNGNWIKYIPLDDIDSLLAEMVGGENA